jgi:hypothetical protein
MVLTPEGGISENGENDKKPSGTRTGLGSTSHSEVSPVFYSWISGV